jgi:hypothetical protein
VTWLDHHRRSKKLAADAQSSLRRGDEIKARELYAEAAQEAERALAQVPREKEITLGVIAMLAAALWRRAHRTEDAARLARLIRGAPELFPITLTPLHGAAAAPAQPKRG